MKNCELAVLPNPDMRAMAMVPRIEQAVVGFQRNGRRRWAAAFPGVIAAALDHEVLDHAVEDGAVVVPGLHVLQKVGNGSAPSRHPVDADLTFGGDELDGLCLRQGGDEQGGEGNHGSKHGKGAQSCRGLNGSG